MFLIYAVSGFSAIGGFLFGYDIGVISGVLVTPSFIEAMYPVDSIVQGAIVSLLIAGCFFGSLIAGQLADRLGRKFTILEASIIFVVGALIQTIADNVKVLYVGRFIAGLAIGQLSMVVPLYQSEIAPANIRGRLVALQQWAITIGIAVSFWVDYGCQSLSDNMAWRVPLGLQMVPAVVLAIGTIFLPYSPRWLMNRDRDEEARQILCRLRCKDIMSMEVQEEYDTIKHGILLERELAVGSYLDLFRVGARRRVVLGILLQAFQQLTGINAIMYYAPIIFEQAGVGGVQAALLAQGINGVVNMVATIPAILYIDTWGRRPTLISGSLIMTVAMVLIGGLLGGFNPPPTAVSYLIIVSIYLFAIGYAYSWGPIGWIYPSEIFPLRIRSKAISLTTASNWLANYLVGMLVPILLERIGFYLYFIFAGFGFLMTIFVAVFLPETKGKSLEEMDSVFGVASDLAIETKVDKEFA